MGGKFQIEALIEQTRARTTHRVRADNGELLGLTRLLLDEDDRERLKRSEMLREALDELKALRHPLLGQVIDCGLDEQGIPWVLSSWESGKTLDELEIGEVEIEAVSRHAKRLLEDLGPVAGAVRFESSGIYLGGEDQGCLFQIDYFRWFSDIASGAGPGSDRDGREEVRKLLASLAVRQLKMPKKKEEEPSIPFVAETSPLSRTSEPVGEPWLMRLLFWLLLLSAMGVIGWLTFEAMERVDENPRVEGLTVEKKI